MNILFFGIYDPDYSRNRILIRGFKENGWTVAECRVDPKQQKGFKKYIKLFFQGIRHMRTKYDFVTVAFPGATVVWMAFLLFGGRRLLFDSFLSIYDSNVYDRKIYKPYSFRAIRDWILDWYSMVLSRYVLIDTKEHAYYLKNFFVNEKKILVVPIGADETVFKQGKAQKKDDSVCRVHFHGMFIPLQGISYILDAAAILANEPFQFFIAGAGQEYVEMVSYAKTKKINNVFFLGKVPLESLPQLIEESDICLGIFGDTSKTMRVIPNKVYECIAMGKPVITADSPASREVLTNRKNVLLCKTADGQALAESIRLLWSDVSLRRQIATAGSKLFFEHFTSKNIVKGLVSEIEARVK